MHLMEGANNVDFPAVFKRIPRPERWNFGDGAIRLDSLDMGLIRFDKYARTCDNAPDVSPDISGTKSYPDSLLCICFQWLIVDIDLSKSSNMSSGI